MRKLLIATYNKGKMGDYKSFLKDLDLELLTLNDLGITEEFEEGFDTFEENARRKAEHYSLLSGLPTLADDSGIEIPFYNMEPGVNTKYWNGEDNDHDRYTAFIVEKIKAIPENKRHAHLRAVLALAIDGKTHISDGRIEGILTDKVYPHSKTIDYPWDSVFIIPELSKYYEGLTPEENHKYNHRRLALEKLKHLLIT